MKYILYVVLAVMFVDLLGFSAWAVSGQKPDDSYHAGMITESVISYMSK